MPGDSAVRRGGPALPVGAGVSTLPNMLKAIIFDFDGVLVDSEPAHYQAFAEVASELGIDLDFSRYLAEMVGFDDREAVRHLLSGESEASVTTAARVAELCEQKRLAFERIVSRGIEPLPGAMQLLDEAVAQMPVAIASGALRSDIDIILKQLDRHDVVHAVVTADDVQRSKPDPQTYLDAAGLLAQRFTELDLRPGDCLAIEDTGAGLASARAAGLMTLGLTTTGPAEQLHGADRVIDNLAGVTLEKLRRWYDQVDQDGRSTAE